MAEQANQAGACAMLNLKKDLGLFVLIIVVGTVVALINPRVPVGREHLEHGQPGRPVRHVLDRRGLRDHHRRHRAVGRLHDRAAGRDLRRPDRQPRRSLAGGLAHRPLDRRPDGPRPWPAHHQEADAAIRRDALRSADLPRRRALLYRRRDRRLSFRRPLRISGVPRRPAAPISSACSPATPTPPSRFRTRSFSC